MAGIRWAGSAVVCAVVAVGCADLPEGAPAQEALRPSGVDRELVFVIDGSGAMGGMCDAMLEGEMRVWECPDSSPAFDAQKEALASAIEAYAPINGTMAVAVLVSTLGDRDFDDDFNETYTGPVVAVDRRVIATDADRASVAAQVRAIEQPRIFNKNRGGDHFRDVFQCLHDEPVGCPTASSHAWALHRAARHLESLADRNARHEICLGGDLSKSIEPSPRPGHPVSPLVPVEAQSLTRAMLSAVSQDAGVDRVTFHHLGTDTFRVVDDPARTLTVEGTASADGELTVDLSVVTASSPVGPGASFGSVAVPVREGDDADGIAAAIAFEVHTAPFAMGGGRRLVSAHAYQNHVVLREWLEGGPEDRFVHAEVASPVRGIRTSLDRIDTTQHAWRARLRAHVLQDYGTVLISEEGDIALFDEVDEYAAAFTRCIAPKLETVAIEVNQVIQDWNNSVPLVEGKDAVVRAFVQQVVDGDAAASLFSGGQPARLELEGRRCLDAACDTYDSLGTVTNGNRDFRAPFQLPPPSFPSTPTRPAEEAHPSRNFHLPVEWLTGDVELHLRWPDGELRCAAPTASVDEHTCATRVSFSPNPGPRPFAVTPVSVSWGTTAPTDEQYLASFRTSARILPVNFLNATSEYDRSAVLNGTRHLRFVAALPGHLPFPTTADDQSAFVSGTLAYLHRMRARECLAADDCDVGMVHGLYARDAGVTEILSQAGTGYGVLLESLGFVGMPHGAHEMTHALGRTHTPFCMPASAVTPCSEPYPWPAAEPRLTDPGWIHSGQAPALGPSGPDRTRIWAVDVHGPRLLDPDATWDYMSYCRGLFFRQWPSKFTYERLFGPVARDGATYGDNLARYLAGPHRRVIQDCAATCSPADCDAALTDAPTESFDAILVGTKLEGAADDILDRAYRLGEVRTTPLVAEPDGPTVLLKDALGATLETYGAEVVEGDAYVEGGPGPAPRQMIAAIVPYDSRTRAIVFENGGVVVDELVASANEPTVSITVPAPGTLWDTDVGSVTVSAADADGDELAFHVEYSADAGASWQAVATDLRGTSFDVPLAGLPGSDDARLRVSVSDGLYSAMDEVAIRVARAEPEAYLVFPEPGQQYAGGDVIMLRAVGADAEDGPLDPAMFRWRSDVDGDLGTGSLNLTAEGLTAGSHTLTVTVADSVGNEAEDSVDIEVLPSGSPNGPDLLTHLAPVTDVLGGDDVNLDITIFNEGDRAPSGDVEVGVRLPDDATFVSATGADWSCGFDSIVRCDYVGPSFEPSNASDLVVTVRFAERDASYETDVLVTAETEGEVEPGNDWDQEPVRVVVAGSLAVSDADIEVTVSDPGELFPGDVVEYVVSVRNVGTDDYPRPITVDLSWPPVLIPLTHDGTGWGCTFGSGNAQCTHSSGTLAAGASLPALTVQVRVDPAAGPSTVPLSGGSDATDADPTNDSMDGTSRIEREVASGPDLAVYSAGPCDEIVDRAHGLTGFTFTCAPAYYLRDQGLTAGCLYRDGRLIDPGCPSPVRVQGGRWSFHLLVENVGTEPVDAPLTIVETLPIGLTYFPIRTNLPWSCMHAAQVVTCTWDGDPIPVGGFAPPVVIEVWIDDLAGPELYNQVSVSAAGDVNPDNDLWVDPEPLRIRQINPPPPPPPSDTDLRVDVEVLGDLTVDAPGMARFTVRNSGTTAVSTSGIELEAPAAPFLGLVGSYGGLGWTCDPRWGSVLCTFSGTPSSLAAGATLPPLEVEIVPGPAPTGETEVAAFVSEPGSTRARGSELAAVAQNSRPYLGTLALSACPGRADCTPEVSPVPTNRSVSLAGIQLVGTDGLTHEPLFLPNDYRYGGGDWIFEDPSWSSDGSHMLVRAKRGRTTELSVLWPASIVPTTPTGLWTQSLFVGSANLEVTGARREEIEGSISPDGTVFVYGAYGHLKTNGGSEFDAAGAYARTADEAYLALGDGTGGYYQHPAWSPTGDRLAFVRRADGGPEQVFVATIAPSGPGTWELGTETRLTSSTGRNERRPAWSPDGTEIAFSADGRIAVAAVDGSGERFVTDGGWPSDYDDHPSWSPDGSHIAFQRGEPPTAFGASYVPRFGPTLDTAVFVVPASGSTPALVARGRHPAWRPADLPTPVAGNTPPVAVDDGGTTSFAVPLTFDVLANDSDPDGDPLTVSSVTQPARGTVACGISGCTYEPSARFVGEDRFTYTVSDGRGGEATATVSLEVTGVDPGIEILRPADGSTVDVPPGTVTVTGRVSLGMRDPNINLLYLVDLHTGRAANRRAMTAVAPGGGLPSEWETRPTSGSGACSGYTDDWGGDGIQLLECALTLLTRSGADLAVEGGVLTFADDYYWGLPIRNPAEAPAVFDVDVSPDTGAQRFALLAADDDANGRSDLEEVLHSIRYGGCTFVPGRGPDLGDDTGAALFGTRPPVYCRNRNAFNRHHAGYDHALAGMNAAFATQPPTERNVAYLVSAGRDVVTEGRDDAPLEEAVRRGTVVHVLTESAKPPPPVDIVLVVDDGMTDKATRIAENLDDLATELASGPLDWQLVLISDTDWFSGTAIGGDARYTYIPDPLTYRTDPYYPTSRTSPLLVIGDHEPDVSPLLRDGADLHFVVVTDEENRYNPSASPARAFLYDVEATYEKVFTLHAIASEGLDPVYTPGGAPCSTGTDHEVAWVEYDIAGYTNGVRLSVCDDDWSLLYDTIEERTVPRPSPCDDPTHALARIARRTGGTCRALSWDDPSYELELPAVPRLGPDGSTAVDHVAVQLGTATPIPASYDPVTGLFTASLSGLVAGDNSITAVMRTVDGLAAKDVVTVQGVVPAAGGSLPVAGDDSIVVGADGTGSVNVLLNDTDPDGGSLRVVETTEPAHGEVSCTPEGICTYTAGPTFDGTDELRYVVADAVDGSVAATITVMDDSDLPPVAPNLAASVLAGETVAIELLSEASDAEGPVTLDGFVHPAEGTLDCDVATGSCTYEAADTGGTTPFTYTVADSAGQTATGLVLVEVSRLDPWLWPSSEHDDPFVVGAEHEYRITVDNYGTEASEGFELTGYLPTGLDFVAGAGDGWSCSASGGLVTCLYDAELAAGATSSELTLTVSVGEAALGRVIHVVAIERQHDSDPTTVVAAGEGDAGPGDAGVGDAGGTGGDAAVGDGGAGGSDSTADGGCGCRVHPPGERAPALPWMLIAGGAGLWWRRRRR